MLTAIRSKCVRGIKHNFPNQFKNCKKCPLKCDEQDTQDHILLCDKLGGSSNLQLDLVFGDTTQQKEIATLYHECIKKRTTLLEAVEDSTPSLPGAFVPGPQSPAAATAAVGGGSTL